MNLLKSLALAGAILVCTSANAGSTNSRLKCQSLAGTNDAISIAGFIPGNEYEFTLEITKAQKSVQETVRFFRQSDSSPGQRNADISVVDRLYDHVWTLTTENEVENTHMSMYALPATVVYTRLTNGFKAQFRAKLQYTAFGEFAIDRIVDCSISYLL